MARQRRVLHRVLLNGRWCNANRMDRRRDRGMIDVGLIHVHPLNDSAVHDLEDTCWCGPAIEGNVAIHHSADGRELTEGGKN